MRERKKETGQKGREGEGANGSKMEKEGEGQKREESPKPVTDLPLTHRSVFSLHPRYCDLAVAIPENSFRVYQGTRGYRAARGWRRDYRRAARRDVSGWPKYTSRSKKLTFGISRILERGPRNFSTDLALRRKKSFLRDGISKDEY